MTLIIQLYILYKHACAGVIDLEVGRFEEGLDLQILKDVIN